MKKVLVASALFLSLLLPMVVLAQITEIIEAPEEFWDTFQTILNILFTGVLLLAIVFVFVGGYQFVTAGGDPEQATKARTTIMYAVIAIVIAALARGLIGVLIEALT